MFEPFVQYGLYKQKLSAAVILQYSNSR